MANVPGETADLLQGEFHLVKLGALDEGITSAVGTISNPGRGEMDVRIPILATSRT